MVMTVSRTDTDRQLSGFGIEPKPPKPPKPDKSIAKKFQGMAKKHAPREELTNQVATEGCYIVADGVTIHRPWHPKACSECRGSR